MHISFSIFTEVRFWAMVAVSVVLPFCIYGVLIAKRAISRGTVLVLGFSLVAIAGLDVYFLQHLATLAATTPSLADDAVFVSEGAGRALSAARDVRGAGHQCHLARHHHPPGGGGTALRRAAARTLNARRAGAKAGQKDSQSPDAVASATAAGADGGRLATGALARGAEAARAGLAGCGAAAIGAGA